MGGDVVTHWVGSPQAFRTACGVDLKTVAPEDRAAAYTRFRFSCPTCEQRAEMARRAAKARWAQWRRPKPSGAAREGPKPL